MSIPYGNTIWWIIRDGLARELLRPIAPWHDGTGRWVVTLNSQGQASAVTYSAEAAAMTQLPQGVRGYSSMPMSRVIGHVTASGLVLSEIAIGVAAASSFGVRSSRVLFVIGALLSGATAMQQQAPNLALQSQRPSQQWPPATEPAPSYMRIWTHTLEAPVCVPYASAPDPRQMAHRAWQTLIGEFPLWGTSSGLPHKWSKGLPIFCTSRLTLPHQSTFG